jgi:hypothetical protein
VKWMRFLFFLGRRSTAVLTVVFFLTSAKNDPISTQRQFDRSLHNLTTAAECCCGAADPKWKNLKDLDDQR